MNKRNAAINLTKSEKWHQFMNSTAAALQINLVFHAVDSKELFSTCNKCASCGIVFCQSATSELSNLTDVSDIPVPEQVVFQLDETYDVTVRNFTCCHSAMEFDEKARIAQALLHDFYDILANQLYEEQLASELTTFHQINNIILSMFHGDHNALDRVVDLILSAAVILFDAEGSWLEYFIDGQQHLLTRGNVLQSQDQTTLHISKTITVEICSPVVHGTLGIISPVDLVRANKFLDSMVHECIIIIEINKLLKLMESKISLILDAVDNMVFLADRSKNICYANKAAAKLLQLPVSELIAMPLCMIDAPWRQCMTSETNQSTKGIKDVLLCGDTEMIIDWEVYPLAGGADAPGWLIIARDCTDYYRLQELGEKTENLVHASTLLNVIAHEIRNPLATFKGVLQLIDKKSGAPDISKYVNLGLKEIKKLSILLDEFSQLGKTAEIALEETDMKAFMEEMLVLVNTGFNGPDIEIIPEFQSVDSVLADKRHLTQAIFNLVKNANEALNHKGRIRLSLIQNDRHWIEIHVSDNGPGILDSIKDKLFKPYFSTKPDGTGLGLAITNSIVSSHNGKINVHNLPEGGACFSILLPVSAPKRDKQPGSTDVLIVTADDLIRVPLERVFKAENIRYRALNRNESIFAVIEKSNPRAVFLDDNYHSCNILNKMLQNLMSSFPAVKILVAGDRINNAEDKFISILKPLNYAKLVNSIQSIIK